MLIITPLLRTYLCTQIQDHCSDSIVDLPRTRGATCFLKSTSARKSKKVIESSISWRILSLSQNARSKTLSCIPACICSVNSNHFSRWRQTAFFDSSRMGCSVQPCRETWPVTHQIRSRFETRVRVIWGQTARKRTLIPPHRVITE